MSTQELTPQTEATAPRKALVIDTNVFIKHPNFASLMQEYEVFTTKSVISELRDPLAKQRAKQHFKEYKICNPEKKHCSTVIEFAKGTGDYVSISVADMEVIALALQVISEKGHSDKIRTVPQKPVNHFSESNKGIVDRSKITEVFTGKTKKDDADTTEAREEVQEITEHPEHAEEDYESDDLEDEDGAEVEHQEQSEEPQILKNSMDGDEGSKLEKVKDDLEVEISKEELAATTLKSKPESETNDSEKKLDEVKPLQESKFWVEGKDWDLEDEEGWITKDNINEMISSEVNQDEQKEELGVCVMTSDFAMQNILLQMGVPLKAHNGKIINRIKSYVLECFSCDTVTRDIEKKFCPRCGNATLLKITCSFNDDGSMILYRKRGYQVSLKGLRYSIPNPKFGRRNNDLILTEDQLNNKKIYKKKTKAEKWSEKQNQLAEIAYSNGWGFEEIKKQNRHFQNIIVGYGNANPNSNRFQVRRSKKQF